MKPIKLRMKCFNKFSVEALKMAWSNIKFENVGKFAKVISKSIFTHFKDIE